MYINYEILTSKNLTLYELGVLQLIKQNKIELLSSEIEFEVTGTDIIQKFIMSGYVEEIKGKAKETLYQKLRTTKKGNEVLEDIGTPEIIEEDIKIFEWLKNIYLESNKDMGNQKKTKLFIALFRVHSGISKNDLAYLCQSFINDESQFEWSKKLEFLFFKPASMYEKFSIDGSRLYQYYLKYQNAFDNKFQTLG